jgi:hypothetical protein
MQSITLASCMTRFSLQSDSLKGETATLSVPSFSSFGKSYSVSLASQTCACLDFVETRSGFAENYFSRWCKHIIAAANETGVFERASFWHRAIASEGGGGPIAAFLISPPAAQDFLTTVGASREWINVYARTARPRETLPNLSGPVRQYGWSLEGKRWSYGTAPKGAGIIRMLLSQIEAINEE